MNLKGDRERERAGRRKGKSRNDATMVIFILKAYKVNKKEEEKDV